MSAIRNPYTAYIPKKPTGGYDFLKNLPQIDIGPGNLVGGRTIGEDIWSWPALDGVKGNYGFYTDDAVGQLRRQRTQLRDDAQDAARQAYIGRMQTKKTLAQQLSASGATGGLADRAGRDLTEDYERQQREIEQARDEGFSDLNAKIRKAEAEKKAAEEEARRKAEEKRKREEEERKRQEEREEEEKRARRAAREQKEEDEEE